MVDTALGRFLPVWRKLKSICNWFTKRLAFVTDFTMGQLQLRPSSSPKVDSFILRGQLPFAFCAELQLCAQPESCHRRQGRLPFHP